jgi:hypothetical protein
VVRITLRKPASFWIMILPRLFLRSGVQEDHMMKHSCGLVVLIAALAPCVLSAQRSTYEVPGIVAWTAAKTYGFTFSPEAASGESVTHPKDGLNTRLVEDAFKNAKAR